ncbi:MAG: YggS family pyridoxal phosphate-dependent enzyme [Candidatus Omnitrophica bacterium]|nr:YggS family pyridoxal phosphate-dependent enzyme [Candidatus Omnitrophota bacterium]
MNPIAENLSRVRASIHAAALRSDRDPHKVKLVLVTKQVEIERMRLAYELGERDFGENRVQELVEKSGLLPKDVHWHLIGHLQTNKVKDAMGVSSLIHSVDGLRLAEKINLEAGKKNIKSEALIQCNTSGEAGKFGLPAGAVGPFLKQCSSFRNLVFRGFMTMAPFGAKAEVIRNSFGELRNILEHAQSRFPEYPLEHLSMGMSQDYEIAVEEGATLVRIGTAVFGQRN